MMLPSKDLQEPLEKKFAVLHDREVVAVRVR